MLLKLLLLLLLFLLLLLLPGHDVCGVAVVDFFLHHSLDGIDGPIARHFISTHLAGVVLRRPKPNFSFQVKIG